MRMQHASRSDVLQLDMRAVDVEFDARLPGGRQQNGADDHARSAAMLMRPRTRTGLLAVVSRGAGGRARNPEIEREEDREHQRRRRSRSAASRCCAVQKKSTPRRKPTNSGGSPSGVSAPPILATRKMKNTTTWTLLRARGIGADQRPDQDHGGAGGADDAGDQRAEGENAGIDRAACRADRR